MPKLKPNAYNYTLTVTLSIILFLGLILLTSASQVIGFDKYNDPYWYLKHQVFFGALPGLLFFIVASNIPYRFWKKIALPLYAISIILLILVFVPPIGLAYGGAHRWLDLKFFSIQPAEIAKITTIIFFSAWFAQKKKQLNSFYYTFLPFIALNGIIVCLIALQPDIGTLSVILLTTLSIYFLAGIKIFHIASLALVMGIVFVLLIFAAPYRLERIATYFNKNSDIQGASYQLNQSLIAIGSGGIWGLGLGQSKQKYQYLPEVIGDSIFAVIGEELGFILTSSFVALYLFLIFTGYRIAAQCKDNFGKFLATGISAWIGYQAFINMSAMVGILPLTGLPLPFISYGSSALITIMTAVGILNNIGKIRV